MEKEHTLRILNALANGVHPATGEPFAADSPYQHPDAVTVQLRYPPKSGTSRTPASRDE